jgi:hypothetical protein
LGAQNEQCNIEMWVKGWYEATKREFVSRKCLAYAYFCTILRTGLIREAGAGLAAIVRPTVPHFVQGFGGLKKALIPTIASISPRLLN